MGTGPCSDPLWVACVCSVPGVTSVKMPEPGKKPGSSRPGVGLSVGHRGLGASTIGGRDWGQVPERGLSSRVLFWLSVSPSRPSDESEGEPGPGAQRGGSQGRRLLGSPPHSQETEGPFPAPTPVSFCSKVRPGLPFGKRPLQAGTQVESRLQPGSPNAPGQVPPRAGAQFPHLYKEELGWFLLALRVSAL